MFAELVRSNRRRLGLTQEELAERAGLSARSIGKIEAARTAARVQHPAATRSAPRAPGCSGRSG